MSYNGWGNRETWLVNIWYNPETEEHLEYIKNDIEEIYDNLPGFFQDFTDLSLINWDELKEHVGSE